MRRKWKFRGIMPKFRRIGRDLGKSSNFLSQNRKLGGGEQLEIGWQIFEKTELGALQFGTGEYIISQLQIFKFQQINRYLSLKMNSIYQLYNNLISGILDFIAVSMLWKITAEMRKHREMYITLKINHLVKKVIFELRKNTSACGRSAREVFTSKVPGSP